MLSALKKLNQYFQLVKGNQPFSLFNPIVLRKAKIVCNFGLSECNRVNFLTQFYLGAYFVHSGLIWQYDKVMRWKEFMTEEMLTKY